MAAERSAAQQKHSRSTAAGSRDATPSSLCTSNRVAQPVVQPKELGSCSQHSETAFNSRMRMTIAPATSSVLPAVLVFQEPHDELSWFTKCTCQWLSFSLPLQIALGKRPLNRSECRDMHVRHVLSRAPKA